jgi:hypothetical protein
VFDCPTGNCVGSADNCDKCPAGGCAITCSPTGAPTCP